VGIILTEKIIEDFSHIIECFNMYNATPKVNTILKQWKKNKKNIYEFLGKKLIIKYPINLTITENDYQHIKKEFLIQVNNSLIGAQRYNFLTANIDTISLIKNSLQYDTIIDDIFFCKGTKISKICKKIMLPLNFTVFDKLYSNLLQTLSINGNLCISIHPLDYLTMGDNLMKWSSCHSLEGEYRGGLLSLLVDKSTIVCYVESDKNQYYIGNVLWNNKKWRQLIHVDPEQQIVLFNTQYPYEHQLVYKELINKLQNLFNIDMELQDISTDKRIVPKICTDYTDSDVLHHNDLLCMNVKGKYENNSFKLFTPNNFVLNTIKPILVGLPPYCPVCGKYIVSYHGSLECNHCNPFESCCNCGEMYTAIDLHEINNELFCDTCFDEYFEYCEICDELISKGSSKWGLHNCEEEGQIALFM